MKLDEMKVDSGEMENTVKALASTGDQLKVLSKGLDKTQLHYRSDEGSWSANDNLADLRACSDV